MLRKDQGGVTRYGYDKSNRLITVEPVPAYMPGEEAFIYDKNGNRRFDKGAKDYKYDAANRLQENTVYAYTHDANGNLTGRTHKAGGTSVTYAYNLEQQLSEVVTSEHKLQYKYDPLGRRIGKSVDGSPIHYVYDNEDIIAMLDGEGKILQTFTHGPGIDEPLIMTKVDGANYYYHADGLGSIVALTDDNSHIAETYGYKAYGQPKLKNAKGEELTASAIGNPYLFTARELDPETGLYYYRARYYDWQRGAFTQEDPIGLAGGVNTFIYVANNPILSLDPFGLELISPEEGQKIADVAATWVMTVYAPDKEKYKEHVYAGANAKKKKGADCSGSVFAIYNEAGFFTKYFQSREFIKNLKFKKSPGNIPQIGDVGLYKGHLVIYDPRLLNGYDVWPARDVGKYFDKAQSGWFGVPTWYRYDK